MTTLHPVPEAPSIDDPAAQSAFESGHLWILEWIDCPPLRFQLQESGVIRFGDDERVFSTDRIPDAFRHAVEHVRTHLDRTALRQAVDSPEDVVFFGVATHKRRVSYDWDRMPSFLGIDIWSEPNESYLAPDSCAGIYDRLGLSFTNVFEREVNARDLDPDGYEIPDSNWYDGTAAGVTFRNKAGGRASLIRDLPDPESRDFATIVDQMERILSDERIGRIANRIDGGFDPIYATALDELLREYHRELEAADPTEEKSFRTAVADCIQEWTHEL